MGLAPKLGRGRAHDVVYGACKKAIEEEKSLLDVLRKEKEVTDVLKDEELKGLCEEGNYMGMAGKMVDQVPEKK
jgi:3-carboxy-cis,cis-muconate cycloisomerase